VEEEKKGFRGSREGPLECRTRINRGVATVFDWEVVPGGSWDKKVKKQKEKKDLRVKGGKRWGRGFSLDDVQEKG